MQCRSTPCGRTCLRPWYKLAICEAPLKMALRDNVPSNVGECDDLANVLFKLISTCLPVSRSRSWHTRRALQVDTVYIIISLSHNAIGYATQLLTPSRIKRPHAALALDRAKLLDETCIGNDTASRTELRYIASDKFYNQAHLGGLKF